MCACDHMRRCFHFWPFYSVFAPPTTDDELKDIELQKRIRQLKWVTKQHLDAAIDLHNKEVLRLLEDAQNGRL